MPIKESTTWLIVTTKKKRYMFKIICLLHLKQYAPFATSAMQATIQLERQSEALKRKLHSPWTKVFRISSVIIT